MIKPTVDEAALNPFYADLSELIGTDAMLTLFENYRGMQLTIPTHLYERTRAAKRVRERYDGQNTRQLARQYGYSQRWVVKTLREN
ncbi:Mor transcription activator family protein [Lactiplantibacillus modestisalitolerans]|uniref:Mor transcription activator family protein n=1 Tax=Lactiplantibacillus modestisalitolerans TaxID=1457219 RepID=A0ABV5WRB5_9LACO|nr:Mor transcription activator family protein [Lactiplantibacillus modestisalitolerans]